MPSPTPRLSVRNLTISFGEAVVVKDVSFDVYPNEVLAIVGESGSGKSTVVFGATGLPIQGSVASGKSFFEGEDLLSQRASRLRTIFGKKIGYIFQDVMTSLNPVRTVRAQIRESFARHMARREIEARAIETLKSCGIIDPVRVLDAYPHELSGGLRQRVMIALAAGLTPALLVADEPTTALDTSTQAQVLDTLSEMARRNQSSVILVTHNLGVVAALAHRVLVMYCGHVVEIATTDDLLHRPKHPYTAALLAAVPLIDGEDRVRLTGIPGEMPSPQARPEGCVYAGRCPRATNTCHRIQPALESDGSTDWQVACHHPIGADADLETEISR